MNDDTKQLHITFSDEKIGFFFTEKAIGSPQQAGNGISRRHI